MAQFENGLFGCFSNIGLCVFSYFVPCYTHGKTAEAVGAGTCLICALSMFVPFLNIWALITTRGKVRESKGIDGTLVNDLVMICFCAPCAVIQSALEMGVHTPLGAGESMARV
ncbi:cornifelin homolog B-like [Asterias amurensis]|uniref:cornifelin homolog B-like n=1 Tax=Asterias amurensis TaxID=7602 RepID=UPI003AB8D3C4